MHWLDDYVKRLLIVLVVGGVVSVVAIALLQPSSWGEYGNYRGDALKDEAAKPLVYGDNASCVECHGEINELARGDVHKNISCEMCHTPVSEHVRDGKKIKDALVVGVKEQNSLCLKCHSKMMGRGEKFPMVDAKLHLEELEVRPTSSCNRCHTVHAPMENINYVKKLRELREKRRALKEERLLEESELRKLELEKAKDSDES